MTEFSQFGQNLRDLIVALIGSNGDAVDTSLLREIREQLAALNAKGQRKIAWGPVVDTTKKNLKALFAGTEVKKFSATPGGIDNLALSSTDVFSIPGRGDFSVNFDGYFEVTRDDPTTDKWATREVFVNMTDLNLQGKSDELGPIKVRLNNDIVSAGQVFPAGAEAAASKCRIATGAEFEMSALGVTAFNKEPILLKNDAIESVPPIEDPNGIAHVYELPLFDKKNPDGKPVAYLQSLRYTVGNYITPNAKLAFKSR